MAWTKARPAGLSICPALSHQERRGRKVECLTFESLYEPHAEEPGRERWLGYEKNRTVHAWVSCATTMTKSVRGSSASTA